MFKIHLVIVASHMAVVVEFCGKWNTNILLFIFEGTQYHKCSMHFIVIYHGLVLLFLTRIAGRNSACVTYKKMWTNMYTK